MDWPIWLAALLSSVLTLPALSRSLASLRQVSAPEGCGSVWLFGGLKRRPRPCDQGWPSTLLRENRNSRSWPVVF